MDIQESDDSASEDENLHSYPEIETDTTRTKLLAGKHYEKEDIQNIAKLLFKKYQHDYVHQFLLVESIIDLKPKFQKVTIRPNKPLFIILAKENKKWILLCVIQQKQNQGNTLIFFKDPCGDSVSKELKNQLRHQFPECKFIVQTEQDCTAEDPSWNYGPLTLRNLNILLRSLKTNPKLLDFTSLTFVNVRYLSTEKRDIVLSLVNELLKNKKFMVAVREFVDKIPEDLGNFVADYEKALQEELGKDKDNIDYARLKAARENCLKEENLNRIKDDLNITVETKDGKYVSHIDIETKFPKEMKKFSDIFQFLNQGKVNKQLFIAIKSICQRLKINYKKIEFLYKIKKPETKTTEVLSVINKDEIKQMLPKPRPPQPNKSDQCAPMKELLNQIIIGMDTDDGSSSTTADFLRQIEEKYNIFQAKYENWKNSNYTDIATWAKKTKLKRLGTTDDELCEALAVMDKAHCLIHDWDRLRATHILTVLTILYGDESKGHLCQVQTGEGKTIMVSLLAAIRVLQGYKVDVITSNPLLADEGVNETKVFYSFFYITYATNNPGNSIVKVSYTADVLYGTISNFQFDFLKDSFEGVKIRNKRPFDHVILDEVDSMLVDNGGYIAKLSAPFPGMEFLRYIYIKIWQELIIAEKSFAEEGQTKLQEFIRNNQDAASIDEYWKYIKDRTLNERKIIKDKIRATDPTNIPLIPNYLKSYAKRKLDVWLKNALHAKYNCQEHHQYRIITNASGEKYIAPVDFQNTGVTLKKTIWSYGLHQFIQLKHNLQLTSESLTSSFISNIGYIKNYHDKNLFGLTGTLGSRAEQSLLQNIYKVDFAKLPTFKTKKFTELPGIVFLDDIWATHLVLELMSMVDQQRAVLAILETEQDLLIVKEHLELLQNKEFRIRMYAYEENAGETSDYVKIGDIILATNIAGRGTNFRTEKSLEAKGGLHVCVGFLPCNLRVEDQAFGRTSRQGNNGTAQLILRQSEVENLELDGEHPDFVQIKKKRDVLESDRLQNINDVLLKEINFNDELFKRFSIFYTVYKNVYKTEAGFYVLQDLKEYWAFWLDKKDFKIANIKDLSPDKAFKNFCNEYITKKIISGTISHNPCYLIQQAQCYLDDGDKEKACESLKSVISMSGDGCKELLVGVYLTLFEISILKGEQLMKRFRTAIKEIFEGEIKGDYNYIKKAKSYLQSAKDAIEKELNYLVTYFGDSENNKEPDENFTQILTTSVEENTFLKHITSRRICLLIHHQNINGLLEELESFDGADITGKTFTNIEAISKMDNSSEMVKNLTNCEMDEMHQMGLECLYGIRDVHDVPYAVITSARAQIIGGLATLVAGLIFPPFSFVTSSMASTAISNGIIDIAVELLSQGQEDFEEAEYIKITVITYGVSILTFGVSAIANSVKIVTRALKECRKLAKWLKQCKHFKGVCSKIAKLVDKIGNKFEKMLSKMNKAKKLTRTQQLAKTAVQTGKRVAFSIVNEFVIGPLNDKIQEKIREEVIKIFKEKIESSLRSSQAVMEKLRTTRRNQIDQTVAKFLKTDDALDVALAVGKELLSAFNNSIINAVASAVNIFKNMAEFGRLSLSSASYLEDHLAGGSSNNNSNKVVENVSSEIAEKMYNLCADSVGDIKTSAAAGLKWGKQKIKDKKSGKSKGKKPSKKPSKINKNKVKKTLIKVAKKVVPTVMRTLMKEAIKEVKTFFETELKKAIRNNEEVMKKLKIAPEDDIYDCVTMFMKGNDALSIARKVESNVFKSAKGDIARLVHSASNIIMDSIDFASYFTNLTSFLEKKLPNGKSQNNVDEIIKDMTTRLADQMFDLLQKIGKNGVSLGKTMYNISKSDMSKMLNVKNVVKDVFNKENLTNVATSMLKEDVYQPLIDEFLNKIEEGFKVDLQIKIKENTNVVKKIQTAPVNTIESCVEKFLQMNDMKNLAESIGTKVLQDSKSDASKIIKESYNIVKKLNGFDRCNRKIISFLETNLVSEDLKNDTNEIVDEISSVVAKQMFQYLCAIVKGDKNIVVEKKIKLKHLKSIRYDKESFKNIGAHISTSLQKEFINQTSKQLSQLNSSEQIKQFLNKDYMEKAKRTLVDIIPLFQEDEMKNFTSMTTQNNVETDLTSMTVLLEKEAKKKIFQSFPNLCSEENFFKIVGAEAFSVVKKVQPFLDAELQKDILGLVGSLINNKDLVKTLMSQLHMSLSRVKDNLKQLSPVLIEASKQFVTSTENLLQTLSDITPMVEIVVKLYIKKVSSQVSLLASNNNLKTLLSRQLSTTLDKIEAVLKDVLYMMSEQLTKTTFVIVKQPNLKKILAKQCDLCRAQNVIKIVIPFAIEDISKFISQLDLKELSSHMGTAFNQLKLSSTLCKEVTKLLSTASDWLKSEEFPLDSSWSTINSLLEIVVPVITNKISSQIFNALSQLITEESFGESLSNKLGTSMIEVKRVMEVLAPILSKKITKDISCASYRLRFSADLRKLHREYHVKDVLEAVVPLLKEEVSQILESLTEKKLSSLNNNTEMIVVTLLREELKKKLPNLLSQLVANNNLQNVLETQLTSSLNAMAPALMDVISVVTKKITAKLPELVSNETFRVSLSSQLGTTSEEVKPIIELLLKKIDKELSGWVTNFPNLNKLFIVSLQGCNEIEALTSLLKDETTKQISEVVANTEVTKVFESQFGGSFEKIAPIMKQELLKQLPRSGTKLLSNEDLGEILGPTKPLMDVVGETVTSRASLSLLKLFSSQEFQEKLPSINHKTDIMKVVGEFLITQLEKNIPKTIFQLISKQANNVNNLVIKTMSPFLEEEIWAQVEKSIDEIIDDDETIHTYLCHQLSTSWENVTSMMEEIATIITEEVTAMILESVCKEITTQNLKTILAPHLKIDVDKLMENAVVPELCEYLVQSERAKLNKDMLKDLTSVFNNELIFQLDASEELHEILSPDFSATVNKIIPKAANVLPVLEKVVTLVVTSKELKTKFGSKELTNVVVALEKKVAEFFSKNGKTSPLVATIDKLQSLVNDEIVSQISTALKSKHKILKDLNVQRLVDFGLLQLPEKLTFELMEAAKQFSNMKDSYDLLGIPLDATLMDIKRQYRKIVLYLHPKRNPDNQRAKERFKQANEEYEKILKNFNS